MWEVACILTDLLTNDLKQECKIVFLPPIDSRLTFQPLQFQWREDKKKKTKLPNFPLSQGTGSCLQLFSESKRNSSIAEHLQASAT